MPTPSEVREIASERGRARKRKNAVVALLSGALPGVVLSFCLLISWQRWLIGLLIAAHRCRQHRPHGAQLRRHGAVYGYFRDKNVLLVLALPDGA